MRMLSDIGHADLVYKIATHRDYPAGRWSRRRYDGSGVVEWGHRGPGYEFRNSMRRRSAAPAGIWLYAYLGGIRPDPSTGFK